MCIFSNIEIKGNGNYVGQNILGKYQQSNSERPANYSKKRTGCFPICGLPDLDEDIVITDQQYQEKVVILIRYLLENGNATISGRYIRGASRIPLFRDKEKQGLRGLEVLSIDKKTGQRLMRGEFISRPDTLNKLLNWMVRKFSLLRDMAEKAYNTQLDIDSHYSHIIIGAAMFIEVMNKQKQPGFPYG